MSELVPDSWTEQTQVSPRSPRLVVVFSDDEHAWGPAGRPNTLGCTFHRILEWMGRLWGGRHMIAVPVVDGSIHPVFERLARAYDPDLALPWRMNLAEIELRDPAWADRIAADHAGVPGVSVPGPEERRTDTRIVGRVREHADAFDAALDGLVERLNPFPSRPGDDAHHLQTQFPRPLTALSSLTPWTFDLAMSSDSYLNTHPLSGSVTDFDLSQAGPWMSTLLKITFGVSGTPAAQNDPRPAREHVSYRSFDLGVARLESMVAAAAFLNVDPSPRPDEAGPAGGAADPSGTAWWASAALAATPMRRSTYGLENYQYAGPRPNPALLIVVGDTTADAALFLTWTRMYGEGSAAWLPARALEDLASDETPGLLVSIQDMVYAQRQPQHTRGWITSFAEPSGRLRSLRDALSLDYWNKDVRDALRRFQVAESPNDIDVDPVPEVFTVTPQTFATTRVVTFRDGLAQTPLTSPIPPLMQNPHSPSTTPLLGNWVSDVVVGGCRLPIHPNATNAAEAHPVLASTGELRCGRTGTSWIAVGETPAPSGLNVEHVLNDFVARSPHMTTVLDTMLDPAWTWQLSNAGRYYQGFTRLVGGLSGLVKLLRDSYAWPILQEFVSARRAPGWVLNDTKVLTFDDMLAALGIDGGSKPRSVAEPPTAARRLALATVDDLVGKRILHPGLLFVCTRCAHTAFYPIGDVGRSFTCRRCSDKQVITSATWKPRPEPGGTAQPGWFYRLDGLVEQALRHHVEGPALALEKLGIGGERAVYSWSVTLHRDPSSRRGAVDGRGPASRSGALPSPRGPHMDSNQLEVDFVALVEGRLVVGEAKTSDHLGGSTAASVRKEINKTMRAAQALNADRVVFATTHQRWAGRTEAAFASYQAASDLDVLSMQDLWPAAH